MLTRATIKGRNSRNHSLAAAIMRSGVRSFDEMRALAPLPKLTQELFDKKVISVGFDRLTFVADLIQAGLVYNLPDPLSVATVYWEKEAKIGSAIRTMEPRARGENQLADRTGVNIPIYLTIDDFNLGVRVIRASERIGAPIDVSQAGQATRRVNESIEDAGINGSGITVAGQSAPGLLNAPNVNTQAYVRNEAWDNALHLGPDILTDVQAMVQQAQDDKKWGPYNLYVTGKYWNKLQNDYKTSAASSTNTILERLQELSYGGRNLVVRPADLLPTNRTALVQMTDDVVDVIIGQQPTMISWQDGPGWNTQFAVVAVVIPRVKDDYDGKSGIVVGNLT